MASTMDAEPFGPHIHRSHIDLPSSDRDVHRDVRRPLKASRIDPVSCAKSGARLVAPRSTITGHRQDQ